MADKEVTEMQDQEGMLPMDLPEESVVGAGRVGIIAASYESRRQQVMVAASDSGAGLGHPGDMLVTRDQAAQGLQSLEQRAAQALAGTADQAARAMDQLADQTAAAVRHTAASSQQAVSTLEDQTRDAFGRTESALGSMRDELVSNADKITNLEAILAQERRRHAEAERQLLRRQQDTVADLTAKLDDALTRVDRLSADLAKERSLQELAPPEQSAAPQMWQISSPRRPMQSLLYSQGDEHMVDASGPPQQRSPAPTPYHHIDRSERRRSASHSSRGSRSFHLHSEHSEHTTRTRSPQGEQIKFGVFNVAIKPHDPPTFSGRTQDDPEVWVGQVSNFFRLVGGPPWKQVAYASTLL